ncbi:MAG: carbohydrate ABC transporter permease [Treponema sp.]|jgi:putative aldouronate transport system permease protein|nr:carbohydrate ABC transporter permease [Treponema sp.]
MKTLLKDNSLSSRILDVIVYTSLFFLLLITIAPVLHVISMSFSSSMAIDRGRVGLLPVEATTKSYKMIWDAGKVPRSFLNSVYYTILGTTINMVMTILTAYPLSKKNLPLRGFYMTLIIITMFFGGGLIPSFLLVRSLKMYNTVWALVLPGAISSMNMIIMRTFFEGLPLELEESARLDGASDLRILLRIILPLSTASIATIGMFYAVGHWNSWFSANIYLRESSKFPLQLILREIIMQNQIARELAEQGNIAAMEETNYISVEGLKYATLVISIAPMLVVYPFVQKYFVKGALIGSLKG